MKWLRPLGRLVNVSSFFSLFNKSCSMIYILLRLILEKKKNNSGANSGFWSGHWIKGKKKKKKKQKVGSYFFPDKEKCNGSDNAGAFTLGIQSTISTCFNLTLSGSCRSVAYSPPPSLPVSLNFHFNACFLFNPLKSPNNSPYFDSSQFFKTIIWNS